MRSRFPALWPARLVSAFTLSNAALFAITFLAPASGQEIPPPKAAAMAAVEALGGEIHDISMALWDFSELALLETSLG